METERYLASELGRLLREEGKMGFVSGPRQVGKTTLVRHLLRKSGCAGGYFSWDIEAHRKAIVRDPEGFWKPSVSSDRQPVVALDEIHKYPRWKRFLKGLFDAAGQEVKILVTGSGRLDVYQRGGDSLLGRYGLYRLHPFSVGELLAAKPGNAPGPEEALVEKLTGHPVSGAEQALSTLERFTGFPEPLFVAREERLRRWRRARHNLVLREDLRDLTRIREIGLIETLVELVPERVGAPLSLNALREDLGVAYGTVKGWVEALERLYYFFEIRPYAGKLARTLRREAKVYLFDWTSIETEDLRFENVVAWHLHKACDYWNDLGKGDFKLHYVRDKEKREVDFLVTKDKKPYLLAEAKLSTQETAPALRYFAEKLKPPHVFQVARQGHADALSKRTGGIWHVSAVRFLAALP